jgi:hypothetical protein
MGARTEWEQGWPGWLQMLAESIPENCFLGKFKNSVSDEQILRLFY